MRLIIKILPIIFVLFSVVSADEWQYYFEQGNGHYQNGKYEEAIKEYKKIVDYGYESGELYYNLGNAYFKKNEMGQARLYYEKASKFLKNDEALEQNLKMVEFRLVDKIEAPPKLLLNVWWQILLDLFSMSALTIIIVILLWLLILVSSYRLYVNRRGRADKLKPLFVILLSSFLFLCLLYVHKIYILETEEFGVILEDKVTLHAEPIESSTELFVIHEGSKVEIKQSINGWFEVKLLDGKTGWLRQATLKKI